MSSRLDKSWTVLASHQTLEADRCVDVFSRPDGTFGFEEFRRDPEDMGHGRRSATIRAANIRPLTPRELLPGRRCPGFRAFSTADLRKLSHSRIEK